MPIAPFRKYALDGVPPVALSVLVLAASLFLTCLLWQSAQHDANENLQAEFDYTVRELSDRIGQRISAYEYTLRSTQAFFAGSEHVTRAEFRNFVAALGIEKNHLGTKGIGFARIVHKGEIDRHVAELRRQGLSDYALFPTGSREMYAPVILREPDNAIHSRLLGFDLYSEPSRRAAMDKARDSGMPAITNKLSLYLDKEKRADGFIMFIPIYKDDEPSAVEKRRQQIVGWVYAPVEMEKLMTGLLGERAMELDIEIFDGESESKEALMFDTDTVPLSVHSAEPRLKSIQRIDVGSHVWTVAVHSLPAFEARLSNNKPIYIAVAGATVSLLLALLTFLLSSGRMRALAIASKMNRDLRMSEERYARVIAGSDQGFWEWDLVTKEYRISAHFEAMLGYDRGEMSGQEEQAIMIPPDQWALYVHPEDLDKAWQSIDRHLRGMSPTHEVEIRCKTKSGDWKWLLTKGRIVAWDRERKPLTMSGTITDINERKMVERALRLTQFSVEKATDPVFWMNRYSKIRYVNEAACRHLGYTQEELMALAIPDIDTDFPKDKWNDFWTNIRERHSSKFETVHRHKDGRLIPVEITANFIAYDGQEYSCAFVQDITERKKSEEVIWHQANFDALTGLPNRRMFQERLEQEVMKAQRSGSSLALVFIDLDFFKDVNDTLGHAAGDILLKMAAERLIDSVRKTDMVARLGGDEFTVILTELQDIGSADRVVRNILERIHEAFVVDGESAYISASIGVTFCPNDGENVQDLLRSADQAMYTAKNQGGNRYIYFDPSMQQSAQFRRQMIKHLHEALETGQFRMMYQPIIELTTGRISKAEALIRWHHPTRGMISPAEFIPIAEETDIIHGIGSWVFQEAMKHTNFWRGNYHPSFQVNVNVSPAQFRKEDIHSSNWISQLKQLNIATQGVVVEITEGLLLDASANVKDQLIRLRDAGVEVALDDFGTGYSSLAYLKRFDIDYIKIDKTFVSNLEPDSDDLALCEAMIVMAHKLGIKVIAEGVETEQQRSLLTDAGCDYAQGYFFSHPVSSEQLGELLFADICFVAG